MDCLTGGIPERREGGRGGLRTFDGGVRPGDSGFDELGEARSFGAPARAPSPLRVSFREASGVHEVFARREGRSLSITQLKPGPCPSESLNAHLGDVDFEAGRFAGDLRVRGVMAAKGLTILCMLDQTGAVNHWGRETEAGDLLTLPPNGELEGRFDGVSSYAVATASWGLFTQRAEAFEWLAEPRFWTEALVCSPPAPVRAACQRAILGGIGMLRAMGERLPASAALFLRQEMLDAVLAAMARVRDDGPQRRLALNAARIVRQSEDYLEGAGGRQVVQIDELCQALNVSRRTLYRAFHDVLDVSPKAYLRLKAMSAAREALLGAAERPTTVTQVALDHGFWELGRFAGSYRTMFGEPPSETLRRVAGRTAEARP